MVKKVRRGISTEKYIIIGVMALIILVLGISLGMIIDNERVRWATMEYRNQQLNYESLQLQYLYLDAAENKNVSCTFLYTTLESVLVNLGDSMDKILTYQQDSQINTDEYIHLERRYVIDNFKYWLLVKKAKTECNVSSVAILYFYSEKDCVICSEQGVVLTFFKKKYGEKILNFPINVDLEKEEPFISILRKSYAISEYPTIIVEGDKYVGVVGKEKLQQILCAKDSLFCEE